MVSTPGQPAASAVLLVLPSGYFVSLSCARTDLRHDPQRDSSAKVRGQAVQRDPCLLHGQQCFAAAVEVGGVGLQKFPTFQAVAFSSLPSREDEDQGQG